MKITKDEARILSLALDEFKYDLHNNHRIDNLFESLEYLGNNLNEFGKDKRRTGRTSQNDLSDCLKRFAKTNKK
jgi:hypothetical protein